MQRKRSFEERSNNNGRSNGRQKKAKGGNGTKHGRVALIGTVISMCFVALLFQVYYIKNTFGEEYERIAVAQQIRHNNVETTIEPIRGSILDINKQFLASTYTVYDISLDIRKLEARFDGEKNEAKEDTLKKLNTYLGIPYETLESYFVKDENGKLVNDRSYFIIAKNVDKDTTSALMADDPRDVYPQPKSMRSYTFDTLAASLLGIQRGDSYWGLENKYNTQLTGVAGRSFRTYDSSNNAVTTLIEPQDGYSLVTTINSTYQQFAEEAALEMGELYQPHSAAVLVMNPQTGAVLAMAEYPSFNANDPFNLDYVGSETLKAELELLEDEQLTDSMFEIWKNFIISSSYEPGSIYKPMVVAAALEEGIVTPESTFMCNGGKTVGGKFVRCWVYDTVGSHGEQTLMEAVANSCNVALMDIALLLGREKFYKYQHDFGFGELTWIDLPGEMSCENNLHTINKLNESELATGGMGQGFNVTSIQVLNAFSAVINGGRLMQPYVVSQIIDKNNRVVYEAEEKVLKKVISEETSSFMRQELQRVVSPEGTGKKAIIPGYNIGGKTGTGEQGVRGSGKYTISFIGYLTIENPDIIALGVIHLPKDYKEYMQGSTTATPIIQTMFKKIIKHKGLKPNAGVEIVDLDLEAEDEGTFELESFEGRDTKYATEILNNLGIDFVLSGGGDVITSQHPKGGTKITNDYKIYLFTTDSGNEQEMEIVPNLSNMPAYLARETLENLGFTINISDFTPASENTEGSAESNIEAETNLSEEASNSALEQKIVFEQVPSAGTKVQKGSSVRIKVK